MRSLADVLPGVATSIGVPLPDRGLPALTPAGGAVVVLVDGLGANLLTRRRGHAPFLRTLTDHTVAVPCGFPTTTATSMATFGTGLRSPNQARRAGRPSWPGSIAASWASQAASKRARWPSEKAIAIWPPCCSAVLTDSESGSSALLYRRC